MVVFALPLVVAFIVLTVAAFTLGVKRLVGIRFSSFRTLLAGLLAYFLASPIITAVGGSAVARHHPLLPGLWFVMLGVACALVVGMVFLVVAEALVPSGSLPGPLYWFRGLRRRLARTRRYASITVLIFRYGLGPYLRGARRSELATPEGRTRLARSMALAMEEAGVTFVKLGQVLSTRRDLLPSEFVEELGRLQDQAAPLPWWEIDRVLRSELGSDPDDVFAELDHTPIASASVAQVHAAHLHSGEEVVVKVRRPGVGPVVDRDLDILGRLARSLERSTRWARSVGAITLAEGFAQALHEELDLRVEAANMASVAAGASHWPSPLDVTFPEPHESLCSSGVLVMSRLRGVPLPAAGMAITKRGLDSHKLAHNLLECLLRQIMLEGVFHADPHPGNILLLDEGGLGMLDFGSVGRLDSGLRQSLQRLLFALDRGDPAVVCDALLEVVERPEELNEHALERGLGRFMARHMAAGSTPSLRMFTDLFRLVGDQGLTIPAEVAAVFRALATLEGSLDRLAAGFDLVGETRSFAQDQLAEQLHPAALQRSATDELASLLPLLRRLPRHVDRIAGALDQGRLGIKVRLFADREETHLVTGLLHQALLTILAATSGIMAVLMLGLHGGARLTPSVSLFQFLGYCLLVIAAILALRVLAAVFWRSRE